MAFSLSWPDGATLKGETVAGGAEFPNTLGSASQVLIFETSLTINLADLKLLAKAQSAFADALRVFEHAVVGLAQRARTNAAENPARLNARKTRPAQTSRFMHLC